MNEEQQDQPTVCIDLDGTLAEYHGWDGEFEPIGKPIQGTGSITFSHDHSQLVRHESMTAAEFTYELRARGYRIIIYTCRGDVLSVLKWCEQHGITYDGINCSEHNADGSSNKPIADYYIDDRALRFEGSYCDLLAQLGRPAWWEETTWPPAHAAHMEISSAELSYALHIAIMDRERMRQEAERLEAARRERANRCIEQSIEAAQIGCGIEELDAALEALDGSYEGEAVEALEAVARAVVESYNEITAREIAAANGGLTP